MRNDDNSVYPWSTKRTLFLPLSFNMFFIRCTDDRSEKGEDIRVKCTLDENIIAGKEGKDSSARQSH